MNNRVIGVALATLALASGCNSCDGKAQRIVKSHLGWADDPTAERLVRADLEKNSSVGTRLCGIPVSGLADMKLVVKRGLLPGIHQIEVDAAPIPAPEDASVSDSGTRTTRDGGRPLRSGADGGRDAGSDSGTDAQAKPRIPLRCLGLLSVVIAPILADDGNAKDWKLSSSDVEEATTPGYEWKPESSGGGHHHHHH